MKPDHPPIAAVSAPAASRPIHTGDGDAAWYCIVTRPRCEANAAAWLTFRGVATWEATEPGRRVVRGRVRHYTRRLAPRYLFARFRGAPLWHNIRACTWICGAIGRGGMPAPITDDAMAQMRGIGERMAAIRAAEARAARIDPGDRVQITDGPLAGFVVDVAEVRGDAFAILAPLLGGRRVIMPAAAVRKATTA